MKYMIAIATVLLIVSVSRVSADDKPTPITAGASAEEMACWGPLVRAITDAQEFGFVQTSPSTQEMSEQAKACERDVLAKYKVRLALAYPLARVSMCEHDCMTDDWAEGGRWAEMEAAYRESDRIIRELQSRH